MTKRVLTLTPLVLLLAGARPAHAESGDQSAQLKALQERVTAAEQKADAAAKTAAEAQAEAARIAVKTEALEDGRDASGLKGFKLSGYIDPTYVYNADLRRAGFQFLVPVGHTDSTGYGYAASYFGSVALDVQKEMDGGTKFRLTLIPTRSTSDVFGNAMDIVHEATVSIPLTDLNTRLIAGQMPDWSGYEYLPPTQNKMITHNLLFDFTLPTAYTGVGVDLVRGKAEWKVMLANMNAAVRMDGDTVPVLAYRLDYSAAEYWGWGLAGVNGNAINYADANSKGSWLNLLEVDAYYTRGAVTLQGQIGAGMQEHASIGMVDPYDSTDPNAATSAHKTAQWVGVSALAAYKFNPRLEGVVRADYLANHWNGGGLLGYTSPDPYNGIGPENGDLAGEGRLKGADRYAVTVGGNYAFNANTVIKAEYRYDGATKSVFVLQKDGTYVKDNHLLAASLVVSF